MPDRVTANLPARNFDATAAFYEALGFETSYKDAFWMIMRRGSLEIEFFPFPDLDPLNSSFSACVRVDDLNALYADFLKASLPNNSTSIPRMNPPKTETFGLRFFGLIDLDGSLLRCIDNQSAERLIPRT
jgi:catechol 2,3-dioxygenase-like lactoylglutathione lyase family enzyme